MHPEPLLEIHQKDADQFAVEHGGLTAIRPRRGQLTARVPVTKQIRKRTV